MIILVVGFVVIVLIDGDVIIIWKVKGDGFFMSIFMFCLKETDGSRFNMCFFFISSAGFFFICPSSKEVNIGLTS